MLVSGAAKEPKMSRPLVAICTLLVLTSSIALADAQKEPANDAGPIANATISLESAVAIAEKHANGKAVRAEYERQKDGTWVYDVEVKSGDTVNEIKVDANKGTVMASTTDPKDADDDDDKAD
jgi:uncharacterized membrane protein YkoI